MGLCGGLLLVDCAGRPIEFHCTAPVPPNRAQEILYGSTYQGFLYGETIAKALLEKCSTTPTLIVSNQQAVCSIRSLVDIPTVFLPAPPMQQANSDEAQNNADTTDQPAVVGREFQKIEFENQRSAYVLAEFKNDVEIVCPLIDKFTDSCEIYEPFTRIQLAINEAMTTAAA